MFYLNSTLNFGIPPVVLVFQLNVYYKLDRLLTDLTAQLKGTTALWYSNKTSLLLSSQTSKVAQPSRCSTPLFEKTVPKTNAKILWFLKIDRR